MPRNHPLSASNYPDPPNMPSRASLFFANLKESLDIQKENQPTPKNDFFLLPLLLGRHKDAPQEILSMLILKIGVRGFCNLINNMWDNAPKIVENAKTTALRESFLEAGGYYTSQDQLDEVAHLTYSHTL